MAVFCKGDMAVLAQPPIAGGRLVSLYGLDGGLLGSAFHSGRGPQDLTNPDFRFFSVTPDGFRLLETGTNRVCDVKYRNDSLFIAGKTGIGLPDALNYAVDLGDGRLCAMTGPSSDSDRELCFVSVSENPEVSYFGEYPEYASGDSVERIFKYVKSGVCSRERERLAYFYFYIGRFRLYDYSGELVADVVLGDESGRVMDDNVYERTVYFNSVCSNSDYIFVTYPCCKYGDLEENVPTKVLQWDWDGNLVGQYVLTPHVDKIAATDDNRLVGLDVGSDEACIYVFDLP